MKTIKYYNQNHKELIKRYNSVNMEQLNKFFDTYILKNASVLDVGFGSGRDLRYIKNITKEIYGIDGSEAFIKNIKKDIFFQDRVYYSVLPNITTFDFKFDVIISIAVFMHLKKEDIKKTIENIIKNLKGDGKVIISYSTKSRVDERDFFAISKQEMNTLFLEYGLKKIDEVTNKDSLNRDIEWESEVYGF